MTNRRLQNYLRTHRRRLGLSQEDVAILLGSASGTKISRYENFGRMPEAFTVFAFEIVFNQPARELFAGSYDDIRAAVQMRARGMMNKLHRAADTSDKEMLRKLQALRAIVEAPPNSPSLP